MAALKPRSNPPPQAHAAEVNGGRFRLGPPEQQRNAFVRLRHLLPTMRTPCAMHILTVLAVVWLIASAPMVMAQGTGAGGASSSGGGARGGTAGPAPTAPSTAAPTSPSVNAPAVPAPGVGNTQVDPTTRSTGEVAPGSTTEPATSAPAPRLGQPGASTGGASGNTGSRPGAVQSPNSDGYAECMAMRPSNSESSRESWSATCDRARLPPKR